MASTPASQLPQPGTYRSFVPQAGSLLVVQFPGETMRCPVEKVVSQDAVIVKIDTVPMAKSHQFKMDDMVGVRRRSRHSRDYWEAQTDRDFLAEQKRIVAARQKPDEPKVEPVAAKASEPPPKKKSVGKSSKERAA